MRIKASDHLKRGDDMHLGSPYTLFLIVPLAASFLLADSAWGEEPKPPPIPAQEAGDFKMVIINGSTQTVSYFPAASSKQVRDLYRQLEQAENESLRAKQYAAEAEREGTPEEQEAWRQELEVWAKELDARRREIDLLQAKRDAGPAAKERETAERERRAIQERPDEAARAMRQRIQLAGVRQAALRQQQAIERELAAQRAWRFAEEEARRAEAVQAALEGDFAAQDAAFRPFFQGRRDSDNILGGHGAMPRISRFRGRLR
jgi:hypothetical protein